MINLLKTVLSDYIEIKQAKKELDEKTFGIKINDSITFKYTTLTDKYRKKWNVSSDDFGHLYKNNKKISNTLYRIGGLGIMSKDNKYFMLLKQEEVYYNKAKTKKEKRYIKNNSCILNEKGIEKIVFDNYDSAYLSGGVIYSLNNKYYNIETKELYCDSSSSMNTKEFLFLDNKYDNDKNKRGVMKINKINGTVELFKE